MVSSAPQLPPRLPGEQLAQTVIGDLALNRHLLQSRRPGITSNPMAVRRKERPTHVRNAAQGYRIVAIELADVQLELCPVPVI